MSLVLHELYSWADISLFNSLIILINGAIAFEVWSKSRVISYQGGQCWDGRTVLREMWGRQERRKTGRRRQETEEGGKDSDEAVKKLRATPHPWQRENEDEKVFWVRILVEPLRNFGNAVYQTLPSGVFRSRACIMVSIPYTLYYGIYTRGSKRSHTGENM